MKRAMLVVGLLVATLIISSLTASAGQVRIGTRSFIGQELPIGVRLSNDIFSGGVYLQSNGYLYIFYQGGSGAEQYMIFPNSNDCSNYRRAGFNEINLSMLYPVPRSQKLTVVFSPYALVRNDFNAASEKWLSISEIEEHGLWLVCGSYPLWVAELSIPSTTIGARPCWWSTPLRYPSCAPKPVSPCCYRVRPCVYRPSCYPTSPCLLWWWLMGVILIH